MIWTSSDAKRLMEDDKTSSSPQDGKTAETKQSEYRTLALVSLKITSSKSTMQAMQLQLCGKKY
jgi:hypothetical protein